MAWLAHRPFKLHSLRSFCLRAGQHPPQQIKSNHSAHSEERNEIDLCCWWRAALYVSALSATLINFIFVHSLYSFTNHQFISLCLKVLTYKLTVIIYFYLIHPINQKNDWMNQRKIKFILFWFGEWRNEVWLMCLSALQSINKVDWINGQWVISFASAKLKSNFSSFIHFNQLFHYSISINFPSIIYLFIFSIS